MDKYKNSTKIGKAGDFRIKDHITAINPATEVTKEKYIGGLATADLFIITQNKKYGKKFESSVFIMNKKIGRPTKRDTSKSEKLNIRLTKEDKQLIQDCADRMNISKSDVIVKAIELLNQTVM